MGDYTINTGDNLWNIAKAQYGKDMSNADIQKAVNKIAEANGLDDPNKINAGSKLTLPDSSSIFEKQNNSKDKKEQSAKDNGDVFSEFNNWQKKHAINMKKFAQGDYDKEGQDAFKTYEILTDKIGETFDFMEGKDASNDKEYDEQTLKLGKGEVAQKDGNGDNLVSFKEYISDELASQGALHDMKEFVKSGLYSKDEAVQMLTDVYLEAQAVFNVIDEAMGNDDGFLDETEFQAYYQLVDTYSGAKDKDRGTIHLDDVTGYPEYISSQLHLDEIDTTPIEKMMRNLLAE